MRTTKGRSLADRRETYASEPTSAARALSLSLSLSLCLQLEWVDFTPVEARDEAALLGLDIEDLHLGRYTDVLP
jgi:hypothetical protein